MYVTVNWCVAEVNFVQASLAVVLFKQQVPNLHPVLGSNVLAHSLDSHRSLPQLCLVRRHPPSEKLHTTHTPLSIGSVTQLEPTKLKFRSLLAGSGKRRNAPRKSKNICLCCMLAPKMRPRCRKDGVEGGELSRGRFESSQ
jgi:hypothetical protein